MVGIGNADHGSRCLKDSFDMLYREGEKQPKMMSIGMHMRVIGHPGRAVGLERLLDYMQKHEGVWIPAGRDRKTLDQDPSLSGQGADE